MIKELIKLADHLDKKGFYKEANYIDLILKRADSYESQTADTSKANLMRVNMNQLSPEEHAVVLFFEYQFPKIDSYHSSLYESDQQPKNTSHFIRKLEEEGRSPVHQVALAIYAQENRLTKSMIDAAKELGMTLTPIAIGLLTGKFSARKEGDRSYFIRFDDSVYFRVTDEGAVFVDDAL